MLFNKAAGSIRDASPSKANPPAVEHDSEDTFHQLMSIFIDEPIGSMSISPANRDVALGAKKGLFIVDLQNPYDPPRYLPHQSAWEVADVQWNPFPARSEWVVATSSQQAVVYNLSLSPALSVSPIEHALYGHVRAVTDVNWSPGAPEVLATCAMDGWVMAWDLRTGYGSTGRGRKPIWRVCGWGSPATQVKFNRREPHVIASSHANVVHIWDDRMGAAPVETIQGHSAKIYGIDWSRKDPKKIITCSLDQSFKSWRLGESQTPLRSVMTSSPIWRARWLPFGDGVLSLPQRSDHALSVWSYKAEDTDEQPKPVARFEGAREGVKEYVWRMRGGEDLDNDDRQFQLVTWARDRRLRLWPISESLMKEVGHVKGSRIEVPVSRRGGPDISYRSFFEAPAPPLPLSFTPATPVAAPSNLPKHLGLGTSLLSASLSSPPAPSLLTSSLLNASQPNPPQKENIPLHSSSLPYPATAEAKAATATMTTTKVRNRREKAHDRLAWMEGVKIIRPPQGAEVAAVDEPEERPAGEPGEQTAAPLTRASSAIRGTDGGTVTAREGDETERAESVVSGESRQTGTAVGKEYLYANLGEEVTSVVRRFPRINFEKVHVAGRTCTVSLYSPLFVRAVFTFPRNYPASAAPQIELERSIDISLKQRASILQGVRRLMVLRAERGLPSLEQALRFLLGDRSVAADEEDDDEAEEALDGVTMNLAADILRNNVNVPPPRRGGASFGPSGQLVVFFPTNVLAAPESEKDVTASPPNELDATPKRKFPLRLSEAFGNLPSESPEYESEYQEADEALQVTTTHSFRPYSALRGKPRQSGIATDLAPSFSTLVKIKDVSHLTLLSPTRTLCTLSKPPLDVAREAALGAAASKDLLLSKVWATMVAFLESGLGIDSGERTARLESLLAERLLQELLKFLAHLKDIQTLGVIACLLEAHTRDVEAAVKRREASRQPEIDYFSQRHRPLEPLNDVDESGDRTPLPTAASYRRQRGEAHSPKPSWANLSGFFNSSMLSLRSASSSSPSSPDRTPGTRPASLGAQSASPATTPGFAKSPLRSQQTIPSAMHHAHDDVSDGPARARSKTSPNVTFGGTSVALIPSKSPVPAAISQDEKPTPQKRVAISLNETFHLHKPVCWWLTDRAQLELELIRLAYAELLCRWGLDIERAHVLKLCRSAVAPSPRNQLAVAMLREANGLGPSATIETPRCCVQCGSVVRHNEATCGRCRKRQRATLCILCHLPVSGLMQSCTTCCHVGHLDCLQRWFSSSDVCPSGCGCSCVSAGGSSGLFLVPRSRFSASIDPPAGQPSTVTQPIKVVTPSWVKGVAARVAQQDRPIMTGYSSFG
ncbi:hypothetical protein JCM3770_007074 [Rhodotorula araucariae]